MPPLQTYLEPGSSPHKKGEAAVRDANDSFEVLLIQRDASGTFRFLPWIESGRNLDRFHEPPEKLARELAKCSVQLPVAVTGRHEIGHNSAPRVCGDDPLYHFQ